MRTFMLAICLVACGGAGGGGGDDAVEVQAGLDELVQREVQENQFLSTGVTVRLADGSTLQSAAGLVGPEDDVAYDVSTEQVIGSVSKVYTAVVVMQLVEAGLISLDDTVDRWISFDGAGDITVRMLLSHTSGLNDHLNLMTLEELGQPWTPEDMLQVALDAERVGEPGMAQAIYTNTNFLVLAMIVEAETGTSWEENIHERIAVPLGLEHTYYAGEVDRAAGLAGGWVMTDGGWLDSLSVIDPSVGWGYGAMVTTNEELLRFTEALFDGELFESPETLAQMTRYDTEMNPEYLGESPPSRVGLCLIRLSAEGIRLDGHLGHIAGFNAAALRDADTGEIMVVTSNDDRAYSGYTAFEVAEFLRDR